MGMLTEAQETLAYEQVQELFDSLFKHFEHWTLDFKSYGKIDYRNPFWKFEIPDRFMDFYEAFQPGKFQHVLDEAFFSFIYTIQECMKASILSLPNKSDVSKFVKSYYANLGLGGNALDDESDRIARRIKAIVTIQTCWRNAISNPEFKLCRNRLMKEFREL
jgi:hypothetical protein